MLRRQQRHRHARTGAQSGRCVLHFDQQPDALQFRGLPQGAEDAAGHLDAVDVQQRFARHLAEAVPAGQIGVQQQGLQAFMSPAVDKVLKLTDEQKEIYRTAARAWRPCGTRTAAPTVPCDGAAESRNSRTSLTGRRGVACCSHTER